MTCVLFKTIVAGLRVLCLIIFLFPKPNNLSVPYQQQYYQFGRGPGNMELPNSGIMQNFDGHNLRTNEKSILNEPGFDFTDDEMKRLKLWKAGVIPYYIDIISFSDKVLRDKIRWFLNEVGLITSVNFVELPRPPIDYKTSRWVMFINRRSLLGCADHSILNFTNTGVQRVVLGYDCISKAGGLADAVLAIVGVPPQHNAPNRDDYIEILYDNIKSENVQLYNKIQDTDWLFHDLNYDFASAGHVSYYKHSAKGRATFKIKEPYEDTNIGNHRGFSYTDILKIKMLYNYIVKKTRIAVPKCDKLFLPSNKMSETKVKDSVEPREKPNKYLQIESKTTETTVKYTTKR